MWRRHTTPDPSEKASETWPKDDSYKRGGASTWITGSCDPELDLSYWGTSNGGPWTWKARPGDNLWVASVIAIRPKTGEIAWHYQWTPAETYDYDGNNEKSSSSRAGPAARTGCRCRSTPIPASVHSMPGNALAW